MTVSVDISIVIPTYNRQEMLPATLDSALAQTPAGPAYEIIVVDNCSTDGTRRLIERYAERHHDRVKYVYEPRQGVSHARNAGIEVARGTIIAFADDDVQVSPSWTAAIKQAFDSEPGIDFIGGKVLPTWVTRPPSWITREHWAPLALLDYGDSATVVDLGNPIGLISANLAVRREVFARFGAFAPDLQRVKDAIGSMEDHDLIARWFRAGLRGLYVPQLVVYTDVPATRMEKAYHRRWHSGHGRFYAIMRSEEFEPKSAARILGVPLHLYKQTTVDAASWLGSAVRGRSSSALVHQMRMFFFLGFFKRRCRDFLAERVGRRDGRR